MGYSDYAPYRTAFDKKLSLDNKLNNPNVGLAAQMAAARTKYGIDSKEYKAAKAKFDATDKEYRAAVSALSKIKAKLDSQTAKEKTTAAKAKSVTSAKSEIATLEMQIAAAREQNKPALEVKALQNRLDVLRGVVSGTPPVKTPDAPPVTSLSEWDNYTVNTMKGTVTAPGGLAVYFANVKGADGKSAIQGFTSMSQARTAFLSDYKTEAQITGLKNQLVKSGYLKANQINTTEWLGSVDTMLAEYTYKTMISYKYEGVKTPALITSWLSTRTATGTGSTNQAGTFTVPTTSLSTRLETNRDVDEFFQDWLTRPATPEEKDAYFAAVNKAESLAVNKRSTTTNAKGEVTNVVSQGDFLTDGDRLVIAAQIARPSLANINIDALLAGGGKLAQNINELNAYAASMGLPKDNSYVLQAATGMLDADGLTVQKEKIKNEAMLHFKPLAAHIQAGGNVQTAAQVYQKIRSNILGTVETPVTDITKDKGLMAAMGGAGLMNLNDWEKMLFKDPLFAKSPYAHEQGASYVSTLLKSFGLMA
jgi:hypothetical protein